MGSKAKIAKYIVPIIQRKIDESGARYYVEPFAGGCNVIDKITGSTQNTGKRRKTKNSRDFRGLRVNLSSIF